MLGEKARARRDYAAGYRGRILHQVASASGKGLRPRMESAPNDDGDARTGFLAIFYAL